MRWMMTMAAGAILTACGAADTLPPGSETPTDLQYSAETAIAESFPVQLYTTVRVHNPNAEARTVTSPDGCEVVLKVYATPARTGRPAWTPRLVCAAVIESYTIAPGETLELRRHVGAGEILGDTLPDGRYHITAHVKFEGGRDLPAGEADLAN